MTDADFNTLVSEGLFSKFLSVSMPATTEMFKPTS